MCHSAGCECNRKLFYNIHSVVKFHFESHFSVFLGIGCLLRSTFSSSRDAHFGLEMVTRTVRTPNPNVLHYVLRELSNFKATFMTFYDVQFIPIQWLPESVRFLAASGQTEKAMHTLKRIADDNGRPMLLGRLIVDDMHQSERGRIKDLLRPETRKTTLLLWFIW